MSNLDNLENLVEVVEGWRGRLPFRLDADGEAVDLTGLDVTLLLRTEAGTLKDPIVCEVDADQVANKGVVYVDPEAETFVYAEGPRIRARFKVVDDDDRPVFFPSCKNPYVILVGQP